MDLRVGNDNTMMREYRKGNWTVQETMVLIEAKKMDDQRRMRRLGDSSERTKPAELRWKWVEDYCWKHGCLRSQNQCNDKWDNLMRDFKKVREYQRASGEDNSYWTLHKNDRKDHNLPSNMLFQIYQALLDALDNKTHWTTPTATPLYLHHQDPPPPPTTTLPFSQPTTALDSDSSENTAKRRKKDDVGSAISKSAAVIAEAIRSCVESEERRHREVVSLQQRRLQIEESKAEINRQAINGLVDAVNKLAHSILTHSPSTTK